MGKSIGTQKGVCKIPDLPWKELRLRWRLLNRCIQLATQLIWGTVSFLRLDKEILMT